jgi:hypothetical protein
VSDIATYPAHPLDQAAALGIRAIDTRAALAALVIRYATAAAGRPESIAAIASYSDATDEQVLANYESACAAEVQAHESGESVPAIVTSTCDEWMREGIRRGIL